MRGQNKKRVQKMTMQCKLVCINHALKLRRCIAFSTLFRISISHSISINIYVCNFMNFAIVVVSIIALHRNN